MDVVDDIAAGVDETDTRIVQYHKFVKVLDRFNSFGSFGSLDFLAFLFN